MKDIWFAKPTLEHLAQRGRGTMSETLGIEFRDVGSDYLEADMPVDSRTKQPRGILNGGASLALAETIASTAGNLVVDSSTHYCVGLEINGNHLRSCSEGVVRARAEPLHLGRSTQVWQIKIRHQEKLLCICRMTLAVLEKK